MDAALQCIQMYKWIGQKDWILLRKLVLLQLIINRHPPHHNVVCLCKIRRDPDDPAECQDHHRSVRNRTFLCIIIIIILVISSNQVVRSS